MGTGQLLVGPFPQETCHCSWPVPGRDALGRLLREGTFFHRFALALFCEDPLLAVKFTSNICRCCFTAPSLFRKIVVIASLWPPPPPPTLLPHSRRPWPRPRLPAPYLANKRAKKIDVPNGSYLSFQNTFMIPPKTLNFKNCRFGLLLNEQGWPLD